MKQAEDAAENKKMAIVEMRGPDNNHVDPQVPWDPGQTLRIKKVAHFKSFPS